MAFLDLRPADLPDYWHGQFGLDRWVYGQVTGLPNSKNQFTTFVFQAVCWQSQGKPPVPGLSMEGPKTVGLPPYSVASSLQYRDQNAQRSHGRLQNRCGQTAQAVPAYFRQLKVTDFSGRSQHFQPGRWGWLPLSIKAPRGQINPGSGDIERWHFVNRLGARATVMRNSEPIWTGQHWVIDEFRNRVSNWLRGKLTDFPAAGRLIPAIMLGDRRWIIESDWVHLNRLGLGHLVAISGLHVGFAAGFGFFLGRAVLCLILAAYPQLTQVRPLQCWAWLCAWFFGAVYSALAGFSVPTVRALLMLSVFCLWRWYFHSRSLLRAWLLAAAVLLGCSPRWVFDTGFVLSFGATGLLIVLLGNRRAEHSRFAQAWRLQWGLGVGLMPLNLLFFQQLSLIAPVINFVLVPVVGLLIVPALILAIVLLFIWPQGGGGLLSLVAWCIEQGLRLIEHLSQYSVAAGQWLIREPVAWLALIGAVFFWLMPRAWRLRPLAVVLLVVGCLHQSGLSVPWGGMRLTVLDVGQGLAVAIQTKDHFMIYDAGPSFLGANKVRQTWLPFMRYHGLEDVDLLLNSHMDQDHAGSAPQLVEQVPVHSQMGLLPLPLNDRTKPPPFTPCKAGNRWHWDGVDFEILYPVVDLLPNQQQSDVPVRNLSCVLKVTGAAHSVLLPGDIDANMEQALVQVAQKTLMTELASDLLVVPHHGSKSSSGSGLLNHLAPDLAVASYGVDNGFGHPHPHVVARYSARGIPWLSTADSGALSFLSDPDSGGPFLVGHWRLKRARLWRYGLRRCFFKCEDSGRESFWEKPIKSAS